MRCSALLISSSQLARSFLLSSNIRSVRRGLTSMQSLAEESSMMANPNPVKVVVIAGPTAVGKSKLAMELCEALDGELISADSVQVYRGLNVGSNKPSLEEQARVRHHLIDVADPWDERMTAGKFVRDADAAVADVVARGKLPVVCGGTPLYLQWLVHGPPDAPESNPQMAKSAAEALQPFEAARDWAGGLALLEALNPARPPTFDANDWYRLGRALEIAQTEHALTANPELARQAKATADARVATKAARLAQYDFRCVFLAPTCRWRLLERIDARCESMLLNGLLEETATLLAEGKLRPDSMAGRAIGYRQAIDYLTRPLSQPVPSPTSQSGLPDSSDSSSSVSSKRSKVSVGEGSAADRETTSELDAFNAFLDGFCAATRNYAGQQLKWFRKDAAFYFMEAPVTGSRRPRYPGEPAPPPLVTSKALRGPSGQLKEAPLPKKPKTRHLSQEAAAAAQAQWLNAMNELRAEAEAEAAAGDFEDAQKRAHVLASVLQLVGMDRDSYATELEAAPQTTIRDALLQQGKRMKTYASTRTLLTPPVSTSPMTEAAVAAVEGTLVETSAQSKPQGGKLLEVLAVAEAATSVVRSANLARSADGTTMRTWALPDDGEEGKNEGNDDGPAVAESASVLFRGLAPPTRKAE